MLEFYVTLVSSCNIQLSFTAQPLVCAASCPTWIFLAQLISFIFKKTQDWYRMCNIFFFSMCQHSQVCPGNMRVQARKPIISRAEWNEEWQEGQKSWLSLPFLLLWDPTWSTATTSGVPSMRKKEPAQSRATEMVWSTSPMKTSWKSWGCSAWRREACCLFPWSWNYEADTVKGIKGFYLV